MKLQLLASLALSFLTFTAYGDGVASTSGGSFAPVSYATATPAANLTFSRVAMTSTNNVGTIPLVSWNGCGDGSPNWTLKAGTVYTRNPDGSLDQKGQAREKLADCGAELRSDIDPSLKMDSNRDCTTDRVSPAMAHFMDTHILSCVKDAAQAAGIKPPKKVFMVTAECFLDRKMRGSSGAVSDHARGNACDIYGFQLFDDQGKMYKSFDTNISNAYPNQLPAKVAAKNATCETQAPGKQLSAQDLKMNRDFYVQLRQCWSANGGKSYGYQAPGGLPDGIIGQNNGLHNDHLHLEFNGDDPGTPAPMPAQAAPTTTSPYKGVVGEKI